MPDTYAIFPPDSLAIRTLIGVPAAPETVGEIADRYGELLAQKAEIETELKELQRRFKASGQREAEGRLFRLAMGDDCMTTTLDRKAIEAEMGETWTARFLKFSKRCGAFTCTAKHGKTRRKQ